MSIYNKWLPIKRYTAMVLFLIIFARKEKKPLKSKTIRHEKIHARQQLELLIIPFYLWYGIEYLINLIIYSGPKEAYRNISFEKEAYEGQNVQDYLKSRGAYSFIKFI